LCRKNTVIIEFLFHRGLIKLSDIEDNATETFSKAHFVNDDKHAKIQAQLDAIRISYIASLKDKHDAVLGNWESLKSDWGADTYDQLYLVIHGLAGSAETFGFPQITRQARNVVNQFKKLNPHTAPASIETVRDVDLDILKLLDLLRQTNQS